MEYPIKGVISVLSETFSVAKKNATALERHDLLLGDLASLSTTSKGNLVAAINETFLKEGNLSMLTTTSKANLVGAINEVAAKADAISTTIVDALDSTEATSALSANQGRVLKEICDTNSTQIGDLTAAQVIVLDVLTSTDATKALSANMGKSLDTAMTGVVGRIGVLETNQVTVANDLVTIDPKVALAATQGKLLNDNIGDLSSLDTSSKADLVGAINEVSAKADGIATTIVDALDSTDVAAALSANQGRILNELTKTNLSLIGGLTAAQVIVLNVLTSTDATKALSANMGKSLDTSISSVVGRIGVLETNQVTVANDLVTTDPKVALAATQGNVLMGKIGDLSIKCGELSDLASDKGHVSLVSAINEIYAALFGV